MSVTLGEKSHAFTNPQTAIIMANHSPTNIPEYFVQTHVLQSDTNSLDYQILY